MVLPKSIIAVQRPPLLFGASPTHFDLFAVPGTIHEAVDRDNSLMYKEKNAIVGPVRTVEMTP
jgi:hypothetical protein